MIKARKYLLAAAALAAAFALSACAGGTSGADDSAPSGATSSPAESESFNNADVTFAQMMIPHHEQAVDMSDDLLAKDGIDPRVVDLAAKIKTAQEPEITQLNEWLSAWNADEGMSGMGDGENGMMSDSDMSMLENASGAEAGRLFLEQMTLHHEGAIAMAKIELDEGQNADAQAMATAIVTSQTEEIGVMKDILATL